MTDEPDVDVIARAIGDPGSVTPRVRDESNRYLESVPRWSARAVVLVLAARDAAVRGPKFVRVDNRDPECVAAWPGCVSFEYDPACCRFPKSCSAGGVDWVVDEAYVVPKEALGDLIPRSGCRAGCPTRDHASWGDCARAASIAIDRTSLRP